jgi:hypothetical protein
MIYPDTFNNDRRFLVSNWSKEDFIGMWASVTYTIKAGETKEFPMYLAYHLTKHFVDREMNRNGCSSLLGVDEARKAYEEKTIVELAAGATSPALQALKDEIRKEIEKEKVEVPEVTETVAESTGEFADLKPKKAKK